MKIIQFWDFYLDGLAPIIPILIIIFKYPNLKLIAKGWVLLFYSCCCIGYFIADDLGVRGINNLWLYNVLPFFFMFSLYPFWAKLLRNKYVSYINLAIILLALITYFSEHGIRLNNASFDSVLYIFFSCKVVFNCIYYFIQEFQYMQDLPIWKKDEFWFISSLLLYVSFSVFIWSGFSMMIDRGMQLQLTSDELKYIGDLWKQHNFIFTITCILFSIRLLWKK